jgi:hypothetical protein
VQDASFAVQVNDASLAQIFAVATMLFYCSERSVMIKPMNEGVEGYIPDARNPKRRWFPISLSQVNATL